ncbi:hypothetical protein SO802_002230 [Lithocarpus litseifolius]|uniref:Aminotransferase-like plant mobile domain-containing protein n=1 Tax=Lithocarpus litseifolius TaxID=425828 RepID=A0AAW2DXJ8_9ROSI
MIACVSAMQQLPNMDPGPAVDTQLTQQLAHRSAALWEMPAASEEVPGVLKCKRRSCQLPRHGLDPQIAHYIVEAGFKGLFKVPNMEVDHALITTLVVRWRLETHTFHLLHGKMGITLQDIEVMLGVPVDGLLVTGSVKLEWPALCCDLLGHRPPDLIPHPHENMSILAGARLRVSWLKEQFRGPLPADAADEVVQQHVRYHILVWLGSILFMDKSADRVSVMPQQFLNPISDAKRYIWGSGALAWLYKHLCKALETKAK